MESCGLVSTEVQCSKPEEALSRWALTLRRERGREENLRCRGWGLCLGRQGHTFTNGSDIDFLNRCQLFVADAHETPPTLSDTRELG